MRARSSRCGPIRSAAWCRARGRGGGGLSFASRCAGGRGSRARVRRTGSHGPLTRIVTRAYVRVKVAAIVTIRMYVRIMTIAQAPPIEAEDRLIATHERVNGGLADLFEQIVDYEQREAYRLDGAR